MRAINIRQPWGWAMLEGGCSVLTLTDAGHKRLGDWAGTLALRATEDHATITDTALIDIATDHARPVSGAPGVISVAAGGLIGVVELTGESHHSDHCPPACASGGWGWTIGWHHALDPVACFALTRVVEVAGSGIFPLTRQQSFELLGAF